VWEACAVGMAIGESIIAANPNHGLLLLPRPDRRWVFIAITD
jgi:hypothetical protein